MNFGDSLVGDLPFDDPLMHQMSAQSHSFTLTFFEHLSIDKKPKFHLQQKELIYRWLKLRSINNSCTIRLLKLSVLKYECDFVRKIKNLKININNY